MKNQIGLYTKGKKLLLLAFLVLGGMFISTEMYCQSKPAATLSAAGILQLPTNVALAPSYVFELSSFGFATADQAIQYFAGKQYADFVIRPNTAQNKAVVMLSTSNHPGWSVAQWNTLLNAALTAQPLTN